MHTPTPRVFFDFDAFCQCVKLKSRYRGRCFILFRNASICSFDTFRGTGFLPKRKEYRIQSEIWHNLTSLLCQHVHSRHFNLIIFRRGIFLPSLIFWSIWLFCFSNWFILLLVFIRRLKLLVGFIFVNYRNWFFADFFKNSQRTIENFIILISSSSLFRLLFS